MVFLSRHATPRFRNSCLNQQRDLHPEFVMRLSSFRHSIIAILAAATLTATVNAEEPYKLGPDSMRHEGVPKGEVSKHTWKSQVFEGTIREYFVYVPKQYDQTKPAAVMVFQDGHAYVNEKGQFRVPVVFDNLIHRKKMPVTIGIFINPGNKADTLPENPWRGTNRSFEYDTLSDQYARFLLEEMLPEVGKSYSLSDRREDRAIC